MALNLLFIPANYYTMRDWLRTLIAGYAGYKWGGGCLGSIVVFAVVYWLLGPHGCGGSH